MSPKGQSVWRARPTFQPPAAIGPSAKPTRERSSTAAHGPCERLGAGVGRASVRSCGLSEVRRLARLAGLDGDRVVLCVQPRLWRPWIYYQCVGDRDVVEGACTAGRRRRAV